MERHPAVSGSDGTDWQTHPSPIVLAQASRLVAAGLPRWSVQAAGR